MVNSSKPRDGRVQFADPEAPDGVEVSAQDFLLECRESALARFGVRSDARADCQTVEHPVPPKPGSPDSTGMIVAHVSQATWGAWERSAPGTPSEKRAHVESEVHLALEDLADQDMHGYLALTETQCDFYEPDLVQLISESLERTTFSHVGRRSEPHWEGTLVERVRPPYLVLAVSIGLADAGRGKTARSAKRGRKNPKTRTAT